MAEECMLYDRECVNCGECDMCDLEEDKRCDDCGKCIDSPEEFRSVDINEFFKKLGKKK